MAGLLNPTPAALSGLKVLTFIACLLPFGTLVGGAFGVGAFDLGANPVETLIHANGKWGLNFLLITLAVTPARRLTGLNWLIRFRRMLGLFAFFYVSMHFLAYAWVDQRLNLAAIGEDILKRPYITIGIAAMTMLIPLAVTSTRGMVRRLGKHWRRLHRLIYPVAVLGVWHYYWQVKQDVFEPLIYAAVLALLLAARLWGRPRLAPPVRRRSAADVDEPSPTGARRTAAT